MTYCLMAPSHYLNLCWLSINYIPNDTLQWRLRQFSFTNMHSKILSANIANFCPGAYEVTCTANDHMKNIAQTEPIGEQKSSAHAYSMCCLFSWAGEKLWVTHFLSGPDWSYLYMELARVTSGLPWQMPWYVITQAELKERWYVVSHLIHWGLNLMAANLQMTC